MLGRHLLSDPGDTVSKEAGVEDLSPKSRLFMPKVFGLAFLHRKYEASKIPC